MIKAELRNPVPVERTLVIEIPENAARAIRHDLANVGQTVFIHELYLAMQEALR